MVFGLGLARIVLENGRRTLPPWSNTNGLKVIQVQVCANLPTEREAEEATTRSNGKVNVLTIIVFHTLFKDLVIVGKQSNVQREKNDLSRNSVQSHRKFLPFRHFKIKQIDLQPGKNFRKPCKSEHQVSRPTSDVKSPSWPALGANAEYLQSLLKRNGL